MEENYFDKTFQFISQKGYQSNGIEFLKEVSVFLTNLLNVNYILIDSYSVTKPKIAKIECFYNRSKQQFLPLTSYNLLNTPCENVINKEICYYPKNTQKLFPKDVVLSEMSIESYVGLPLWDAYKQPIGLIAIMDTKGIKNITSVKKVLQIIAIKTEKVLEKIIFDEQLKIKNSDLQVSKKIIKESENLYKSIITQAGDALYLSDFEGNILEVNHTSTKDTGYSRGELLSMKVGDLDVITPQLEKQLDIWNKLTIDTPITIESAHKRKDGTIFPIEVRVGLVIIDGKKLVLGFVRDISLRNKIIEENKLLSSAVSQSANSIVITDVKGNIEFVNPKFSQITGYTTEEVLGKNPRILNSGTLPKKYFEELWSNILKGNIWQGQFQNKAKNGNLYWEQTTITPLKNEQGDITNFLAIKEDITSQKQAELDLNEAYNKIQKNENYLKRILQTANEGFCIIDKDGNITQVNTKLCNLLGCTEEEFYKKSIFEFVDEKNGKIFKEKLNYSAKGSTVRYEIELNKKTGNKLICLISPSPIYNDNNEIVGYFALITDISKLKIASNRLRIQNSDLKVLGRDFYKKNKQLEESNSRYLNLFEQSPIAIFEQDFSEVIQLLNQKRIETSDLNKYLDEHLDFVKICVSKIKILNVNKAALNLLGVQNIDELITHLKKTNNKKSYKALTKELKSISNNNTEFITQSEFINKKGKVIYTMVKSNIDFKSGIAIASIINITNLKKTELELIIAKEKAEESNRLKTAFINNMSHEIRTPMNGILGFSDLLRDENLSIEKRDYFISIIQNSGKQLLSIIDDILEISRLGTNQVKVIEEKVCLNDLLLELFSVFNLKSKERKLPLYIKNELSDFESTIITDKTKLKKIVSNLLENALKYTNTGHVTFGNRMSEGTLEIFIKDTGIGISSDKLEFIFERFSQEEKDHENSRSGLGLGLSIAKENTELIGGKLSVKSVKFEGSTFIVSLPYKPAIKENSPNNLSIKNKSKFTILVVEDEEVNYFFIEILLIEKLKLNCDIIHAINGKEAVEICKNNAKIDIVLMDINMPIMNGHEATTKIKEFLPNLPIIAQTAYSTVEDKEKAKIAGCDDFITKPIDKNLFNTMVSRYLNIKSN